MQLERRMANYCIATRHDIIFALAPNLVVKEDFKGNVAFGNNLFPKPFIVSDALHNNSFLPIKPRAYSANVELVSPARIKLHNNASEFCIGAFAFLATGLLGLNRFFRGDRRFLGRRTSFSALLCRSLGSNARELLLCFCSHFFSFQLLRR